MSFVYNGMFAFGRIRSKVDDEAEKVIVTERGDSAAALEHMGYPAWKAQDQWEDLIAKERHGKKANYLFVDGHVATLGFDDTVGDRGEDEDMHYVPGFVD